MIRRTFLDSEDTPSEAKEFFGAVAGLSACFVFLAFGVTLGIGLADSVHPFIVWLDITFWTIGVAFALMLCYVPKGYKCMECGGAAQYKALLSHRGECQTGRDAEDYRRAYRSLGDGF